MSTIRKLIESIDTIEADSSITEASIKTTANGEAFLRDVFGAFGGVNGVKDQTVTIKVTLKGANVLEYSITKNQELTKADAEQQLAKARQDRGYF